MESLISPTADQKVCPRCGQPMPAWRNQCETCSAQLAQLPPQVQWQGTRILRPGFVTFYVVLACLGAAAQIVIGLVATVAFPSMDNAPEYTDVLMAAGALWVWIAPGLATLGICMTGLWYMRLWSWFLTVVQLSVALVLIVGVFLLALAITGGNSVPASAVMQGVVASIIIGGSLLWFLAHRRNFVTERAPINKMRLLLSSLLGSVLALLLTFGSLAVLMFLLVQTQSDLSGSLATFLLLPTIPIIWLINGAMVSVWLYRRLTAATSVPAEHGAIVGITTGVASALCLGLFMLLAILAPGFPVSNSESLPGFGGAETTGLTAIGVLATSLLFTLPCSFFGWIGGSLGVRTQKNSRREAVMES